MESLLYSKYGLTVKISSAKLTFLNCEITTFCFWIRKKSNFVFVFFFCVILFKKRLVDTLSFKIVRILVLSLDSTLKNFLKTCLPRKLISTYYYLNLSSRWNNDEVLKPLHLWDQLFEESFYTLHYGWSTKLKYLKQHIDCFCN